MVNQFGTNSETITEGSAKISTTLSGLVASTILEKITGVYRLQISTDLVGGPALTCDVIKTSSSGEVLVRNIGAFPAGDNCALGVSWGASSYLKLAKSLSTFDGTYTVVINGAVS